LPREKLGGLHARIVLRRERDPPGQPLGGVQQAFHGIDIGRSDALRRMRPDVSGRRVDERPLDVKTPDDLTHQRIAPAHVGQPRQLGLHARQLIGDHGGQNAGHPVFAQQPARFVHLGVGQLGAIEIRARVSVDL